MNRASVSFMIALIEPKLIEHIKIDKEYQTISSLIDLDVQEVNELESLGDDFVDILERKNKIIDAYNRTSHILERIKGFINSLYIDYHKLKGSDVQHKIHLLNEHINNYKNENLVDFILGITIDDNI